MAFSFLDLFPSDQAGVVASQGAKQNIEDQYKTAMNFLQLENAMLKGQEAHRQSLIDERLMVPKMVLNNVQAIQGLNTKEPISLGVEQLMSPNAVTDVIENSPDGKVTLMPQYLAELEKAKAQGQAAYGRAELVQEETNRRNSADNASAEAKNRRELATETLERAIRNAGGKAPKPGSPKEKGFVASLQGVMAMNSPEVTARIRAEFPQYFKGGQEQKKAPVGKDVIYTKKNGQKIKIAPDGSMTEL